MAAYASSPACPHEAQHGQGQRALHGGLRPHPEHAQDVLQQRAGARRLTGASRRDQGMTAAEEVGRSNGAL